MSGNSGEPEVVVRSPRHPLPKEIEDKLRAELKACPDVAFAHLAEVKVEGHAEADLTLFVWLLPQALRTLRGALNLVCDTVARVLPDGRHLDVVILNSAPELLEQVEAADCLLVECNAEERRRARAAAATPTTDPVPERGPWWWPFGR